MLEEDVIAVDSGMTPGGSFARGDLRETRESKGQRRDIYSGVSRVWQANRKSSAWSVCQSFARMGNEGRELDWDG